MKEIDNTKRLRQKVAQSYQAMMRSQFVAAENAQIAERALRIAAAKRAHDHILNNHITPAAVEYLNRFADPLAVLTDGTLRVLDRHIDVERVLNIMEIMEVGVEDYELDPEYERQQTEPRQLTEGQQEQSEGGPALTMGEVSM